MAAITKRGSAPIQAANRSNKVTSSMEMLLKLYNPEMQHSKPPMFDAHLHYLDFFQRSDGMDSFVHAMAMAGVTGAMVCGCSLKKHWSEYEERMAPNAISDTDVLQYFSLTDGTVRSALEATKPSVADMFVPSLCGFDPTDRLAVEQITQLLEFGIGPRLGWGAIGEVMLRSGDITNLTTSATAWPGHVATRGVMSLAAEAGIPMIVRHNAGSESTKPYKTEYEYLPEMKEALSDHPHLRVLWIGGGCYDRGDWDDYDQTIAEMLYAHPNLYISITPFHLACTNVMDEECWVALCEKFPTRFMVGTSVRGRGGNEYMQDWLQLIRFLAKLTPGTAEAVRCSNAVSFYRRTDAAALKAHAMAEGLVQTAPPGTGLRHGTITGPLVERSQTLHIDTAEVRAKDEGAPVLEKNRTLAATEIKHRCIDVHMHLLDFLHKSSGTQSALAAMDGIGVDKAVLLGMPCCKKWSCDEPEKPLYYLDDNGCCYVYAYADQMIADAWCSLPMAQRARLAPFYSSFNPTDLSAIDHVRRLYNKYPGMWRGVGEVMCRHDDLTTMLQDKECPTPNHPGLKPIYEFCIEKDLPIMIHSNSDYVADKDSFWEYLFEMEEVLNVFPDLKLIWAHAGVSRRVSAPGHHEMIERMVQRHPNMMVDISWVVWEDVICDASGQPKQEWVDMCERNSTKIMIGSDQVGQFIGVNGENWLKPEIIKYWKLFDRLSPEAAHNIAFANAERMFFQDWAVPGFDEIPQTKPTYPCECLLMYQGLFKQTTDTEGKPAFF